MDLLMLAVGLGTAAGLSPGPLLALVVSTTLERGLAAGLRVAAAPVLSDAPVILLSLTVLGRLSPDFLSAVTLLGGLYVIYLGLRTLSARNRPVLEPSRRTGSAAEDYGRGILVNLLNPHPWLAWTTVMGPLVVEGWRRSPPAAIGFLTTFYLTIVGAKMSVAWLVSRGGDRLRGRWYAWVLAGCGLLLVAFGVLLVREGLPVAVDTMARPFIGS